MVIGSEGGSKLNEAHAKLDDAIDALEVAKGEAPAWGIWVVESIIYLRAELKVLRRRLSNIRKAVGDSSRPSS